MNILIIIIGLFLIVDTVLIGALFYMHIKTKNKIIDDIKTLTLGFKNHKSNIEDLMKVLKKMDDNYLKLFPLFEKVENIEDNQKYENLINTATNRLAKSLSEQVEYLRNYIKSNGKK